MDVVILIAGVAGLAVAGYGFVVLAHGARRRREYWGLALAAAVAVAVVYLLVLFGDNLLT